MGGYGFDHRISIPDPYSTTPPQVRTWASTVRHGSLPSGPRSLFGRRRPTARRDPSAHEVDAILHRCAVRNADKIRENSPFLWWFRRIEPHELCWASEADSVRPATLGAAMPRYLLLDLGK